MLMRDALTVRAVAGKMKLRSHDLSHQANYLRDRLSAQKRDSHARRWCASGHAAEIHSLRRAEGERQNGETASEANEYAT